MSFLRFSPIVFAMVFSAAWCAAQDENDASKALWDAARDGDVERIVELLDDGADVNAKTAYGATALSYASARGHEEAVGLLLERGADPNVKDTFYGATPLTWAMSSNEKEIIRLLLEHGAAGIDEALQTAIARRDLELVKQLLATERYSDRGIVAARRTAKTANSDEITELLAAVEIDPSQAPPELSDEILQRYVGTFAGDGVRYRVIVNQGNLTLIQPNGQRIAFIAKSETEFEYLSRRIEFNVEADIASRLSVFNGSTELRLLRVDPEAEVDTGNDAPPPRVTDRVGAYEADLRVSSPNWPSFRGTGARGVAEGQQGPTVFDVPLDLNVLWKSEVPGLGLSCPVVFGDRVFVTSAISTEDKAGLRIGQYGSVDSVDDESEHEFVLFCFDRETGDELWRRVAHVGVPQVKRHLKSSHANPTATTDGTFVVASFGSEGLYCFDMQGNLAWSRDFGVLDSGWFYDASYQWGFGSSPIIHKDRVIIQCDIQENSFIASLDLRTGQDIWRTPREEIPTWSTPTVCETPEGEIILTNGTRAARGYDADSGDLRWWFSGHSEIVVPTPFVAHGLAYLASGYRPIQPIYAVRPTAEGDLKPSEEDEEAAGDDDDQASEQTSAEATNFNGDSIDGQADDDETPSIVWEMRRGGPYMPTPIVYGDYLYACSNGGIVGCYDALTGEEIYRERLSVPNASSFVASPVASDGNLYLTSEEGSVVVLKAGPTFEVVAVNRLGQHCLSTPAISQGVMFFRCESHLIAVARAHAPVPSAE